VESDFLNSDLGKSLLPILSDAGFEEGGFLPLLTLNAHSVRYFDTTSTTWDYDFGFIHHKGIVWNEFMPVDEAVVKFAVGLDPGADETQDMRVYNVTDGETILEELGVTAGVNDTYVSTYAPTTKDSSIYIRAETRTDPGANASSILYPTLVFGVRL